MPMCVQRLFSNMQALLACSLLILRAYSAEYEGPIQWSNGKCMFAEQAKQGYSITAHNCRNDRAWIVEDHNEGKIKIKLKGSSVCLAIGDGEGDFWGVKLDNCFTGADIQQQWVYNDNTIKYTQFPDDLCLTLDEADYYDKKTGENVKFKAKKCDYTMLQQIRATTNGKLGVPFDIEYTPLAATMNPNEWKNQGRLKSKLDLDIATLKVEPNEGLILTGDEDIIEISYDVTRSRQRDLSMEIWVKPDKTYGNYDVMSVLNNVNEDSTYNRGIYVHDNRFKGIAAGIGIRYDSHCGNIDKDKWTQIVVSYESIKKKAKIYVNGVLCDDKEIPSVQTGYTKLRLNGATFNDHYGGSWYTTKRFSGSIGKVALTNRVMQPDEVWERFFLGRNQLYDDSRLSDIFLQYEYIDIVGGKYWKNRGWYARKAYAGVNVTVPEEKQGVCADSSKTMKFESAGDGFSMMLYGAFSAGYMLEFWIYPTVDALEPVWLIRNVHKEPYVDIFRGIVYKHGDSRYGDGIAIVTDGWPVESQCGVPAKNEWTQIVVVWGHSSSVGTSTVEIYKNGKICQTIINCGIPITDQQVKIGMDFQGCIGKFAYANYGRGASYIAYSYKLTGKQLTYGATVSSTLDDEYTESRRREIRFDHVTSGSFEIEYRPNNFDLTNNKWINSGTLGSGMNLAMGTMNSCPNALIGKQFGKADGITLIDYDTNRSEKPDLTMEIWVMPDYNYQKRWDSDQMSYLLGHSDDLWDRAIVERSPYFNGIAAGIGDAYQSSCGQTHPFQWTQIVVTYHDVDSDPNKIVKVYKNGILCDTQNIKQKSQSPYTKVGLNGLEHTQAHKFYGCIGKVALTNRVIGDSEVYDRFIQGQTEGLYIMKPFEVEFNPNDFDPTTGDWINSGALGEDYNIAGSTMTGSGNYGCTNLVVGLNFAPTQTGITFINYNTNQYSTPELTMEIWIRPTEGNDLAWLLGHDNGGADRAIIAFDQRFGGVAAGVGAFYQSQCSVPVANEWTQIVVRYWDYHSDGKGVAVINVDGQYCDWKYVSAGQTSTFTRVGLNGLELFSGHNFEGCIGKVGLTNRALTDEEVELRYKIGCSYGMSKSSGNCQLLSQVPVSDFTRYVYKISSPTLWVFGVLISGIILVNILFCYNYCKDRCCNTDGR
eukprot:339864_1